MRFISVGKYIVNTDRISNINTDYSNEEIYIEMPHHLGGIFAKKEDAKDLLEWAKEATAKCQYCDRFDCNCGAQKQMIDDD